MLRDLSLEEVAFVSGGMMDTDDGFDGDSGGGDDFGGDGGDFGGGDMGDSGGGDYGASSDTPTYTDPNNGDIVVTGRQPAMTWVGGETYAQFYNDGVAVLYHSDGGYFNSGYGAQYDKMGNFTYSESTSGPTASATSSINKNGPFSFTTSNGSESFQFTHTDRP